MAIAKENANAKVFWHALHNLTQEELRAGKAEELTLLVAQSSQSKWTSQGRQDLWLEGTLQLLSHQSPTPSLSEPHLAFFVDGLNDLEAMTCDLTDACLNASCHEKAWFAGSNDAGENCDKVT